MFKTYLQLSPHSMDFSLFKLIPLGCWFFIAPRSGASPLRNLALQIQGPEGPTWDWEMMMNSQGFSLCEHADWTAGLLSGHHLQSTWMASHRVNIHASLQHPIIIPLSSPCLNHINILIHIYRERENKFHLYVIFPVKYLRLYYRLKWKACCKASTITKTVRRIAPHLRGHAPGGADAEIHPGIPCWFIITI